LFFFPPFLCSSSFLPHLHCLILFLSINFTVYHNHCVCYYCRCKRSHTEEALAETRAAGGGASSKAIKGTIPVSADIIDQDASGGVAHHDGSIKSTDDDDDWLPPSQASSGGGRGERRKKKSTRKKVTRKAKQQQQEGEGGKADDSSGSSIPSDHGGGAKNEPVEEEKEGGVEKEKDAEECAVCLDGLVGGSGEGGEVQEETFFLTPCHHGFHVPCINRWRDKCRSKGITPITCPICRASID